MYARCLTPLRVLPMLAIILAACGGSDVTGPITLGDLAGQYTVTKISVYFKSDPPFRETGGGLEGVQVTIDPAGGFTVSTTAATGLSPESGTITISGNTFSVTTNDTGSVLFHPGIENFTYSHGILSLVQDGVPQLVGLDVVSTTVTTELTKR